MREFCALTPDCEALMKQAFDAMGLTARSYDRILRVARTVADLDGAAASGFQGFFQRGRRRLAGKLRHAAAQLFGAVRVRPARSGKGQLLRQLPGFFVRPGL